MSRIFPPPDDAEEETQTNIRLPSRLLVVMDEIAKRETGKREAMTPRPKTAKVSRADVIRRLLEFGAQEYWAFEEEAAGKSPMRRQK